MDGAGNRPDQKKEVLQMTKDEEIKRNMQTLNISREEAEELYTFDHDETISTPEIDTMTKNAAKIKRYEKSDKPRKQAPKKIDPNKLAVFQIIAAALSEAGIDYSQNFGNEFSFPYCGDQLTVKIIKHRADK